MKLVSKETYEYKMQLGKEPSDDDPVFIMKKLTAHQADSIDDNINITKFAKDGKTNEIRFLAGSARRRKIDFALVDWSNVCDEKGDPVKCTDTNKNQLPVEVREKLVKHINKVNGLDKTEESEDEEKD